MRKQTRIADASAQRSIVVANNNKKRLRIDDLGTFDPLTENQNRFFETYKSGITGMMLKGCAGTGKTFIALYKALEQVMDKSNPYQQVILVRSAVPTREIGHLPGDEVEKTDVYTSPYRPMCKNMFGVDDAFDRLVEQKTLHFLPTSFIRGLTLDDCIIVVDECQNLTLHELCSIATRVGDRCRIVFCGDFFQNDLVKKHDETGILEFSHIVDRMSSFESIEFGVEDIVRSGFVKDFILAQMEHTKSKTKR